MVLDRYVAAGRGNVLEKATACIMRAGIVAGV